LSDPETGADARVGEAPSLMMLLDSGVGLGGWSSEARGQTPQLEGCSSSSRSARDDRPRRALPVRQPGVPPRRRRRRKMPPYPSDLVVRQDKTAMSDAVRRFGQGRR
jgi:two-component system cell cycle sensor histidine kinase/response regulator CckA